MEVQSESSQILPFEVNVVSSDRTRKSLCVRPLEFTFRNIEKKLWLSPLSQRDGDLFKNLIDSLGKASALAQDLATPVTSYQSLYFNDHKLYILRNATTDNRMTIFGFIKVGVKKLYLVEDWTTDCVPVTSYCILDFYVAEKFQRQGHGLRLFSDMLQDLRISVESLAIDRPSPRLVNFLNKHYRLGRPMEHPNKFVTFPGFFDAHKDADYIAKDYDTSKQDNTKKLPAGQHSDGVFSESGIRVILEARSDDYPFLLKMKPLEQKKSIIPYLLKCCME